MLAYPDFSEAAQSDSGKWRWSGVIASAALASWRGSDGNRQGI